MTSVLPTPATIPPAQEHCSSGVGVGLTVGVTLCNEDQLLEQRFGTDWTHVSMKQSPMMVMSLPIVVVLG